MTANPNKMSFNKGMDKNKVLISDGSAMLSLWNRMILLYFYFYYFLYIVLIYQNQWAPYI